MALLSIGRAIGIGEMGTGQIHRLKTGGHRRGAVGQGQIKVLRVGTREGRHERIRQFVTVTETAVEVAEAPVSTLAYAVSV